MSASRTITLFSTPRPPARSGSTALVISVLLHVVGYGWIFVGFWNTPRIIVRRSDQRFTVRILNAPRPEPAQERLAPVRLARSVAHRTAPQTGAGGSPAPMPSVATQLANLAPKQQILIQPDAPPDILLQHPAPLPAVLRWTAPQMPTKTITPAPLQRAIIAKLLPSIEPPNKELTPSNLKMSSTNFATTLPSLPPSTTSPVVVRAQTPAPPHIPETSSGRVTDPAPARVMSLSDLRSPDGPTPIPLANAPARPAAVTSLGTGATVSTADAGHGSSSSKQPGTGAGQGAGLIPGPGSSQTTAGTGNGAIAQGGAPGGPGQSAGTGSVQQAGTGTDQLNEASITRVHVAKDGQFGVVVVGSSTAEQYPETVGLWGGRTVYTVYLHLGHGKAWLLQYSLPPNTQVAGVSRPDAPWPFDMVQPHLNSADFTADALMVHGFVNLAGRFEKLAVVFPTQFAQTKFLLSALQQWQFRPARQNGQLAAVEVLLIIPDQGE